MTEQEVRDRLWAAVKAAGNQRRFAIQHGFTPGYINDVLRNRRDLSVRLLATIGIERVTYYQEKQL